MLYSTMKEANKVLKEKKIVVREGVLISYTIFRPRMYFIDS